MFQVKLLKILNKNLFSLILGLFRDFRGFLRPCEAMHALGEKATGQSKILDLGSQNSVLQYNMACAQFFSKITPPF